MGTSRHRDRRAHRPAGRILVMLGVMALISSCEQEVAGDATGDGSTGSVRASGSMVAWLALPAAEAPIRTEAEKAHGMKHGRTLPEPEFLQPPLDPDLQPYVGKLEPSAAASFVGGASDILPDLVNAWIAAFNEIYPNVDIQIEAPYAGSLGMLEVIDGRYDFVFVSRELKPTDIAEFEARYGYKPLSIPISGASYRHYGFLDAIGFFVNVDNPVERITLGEIDAIFSSTRHRGVDEITTWGGLGVQGSWADQPIHAYGVEPWNGFEEFVRQRVLTFEAQRGEWRDDVEFSHTAFPIAEKVASDPLGIGYTGLAYIDHGVKVLPLVDESGKTIAPSYENVAKATYPLSRLIYFNANRPPGTGLHPVLAEFLRFILSREGQRIVLDQGIYLPLQSWQVESALAALEQS